MAFWSYRDYVPVAQRRVQAAREVEKLKKKGRVITPVVIGGRKIAQSFWGKAWCDNLERYSDFENRLPRGRAYVRNGSVVDLQIATGKLTALVSGSEIYEVEIGVTPATRERWRAICRDCAGSIVSLVELLKGKISSNVMERVCREGDGLFPSPREIEMSCSCPDWAGMCKHVAATLYGVGARLDAQPELLFALRGVDSADLISSAGADGAAPRPGALGERILAEDDVAALFGIEMAPAAFQPGETPTKAESKAAKKAKGAGGEAAVSEERREAAVRKPAASKAPASEKGRAKSTGRRSATAARIAVAGPTAQPAAAKTASPSAKRRSAKREAAALERTAIAARIAAIAPSKIGRAGRKQGDERPPSRSAAAAAAATTKEASRAKKPRGAGSPPDKESATEAASFVRKAKSTKPDSALGPAVEESAPSRCRETEPAGRTRAAKWIGARARKIRG